MPSTGGHLPNEPTQITEPLPPQVSDVLRQIRVGRSTVCGGVAAVHLFAPVASGAPPLPIAEGLEGGDVVVRECSSPRVGQLEVMNRSERVVIGIGGELLCGGKQDRTANSSFVIRPGRIIELDVSCVERGRWSEGQHFRSSRQLSTGTLRSSLMRSVHDNITRVRSRASDQGAVWNEVARTGRNLGTRSRSEALGDAYEAAAGEIEAIAAQVHAEPGQTGIAFFNGDSLSSVDLFGHEQLLAHYLPMLARAAVADALARRQRDADASSAQEAMTRAVQALVSAPWVRVSPAVDGDELRCSGALIGSVLFNDPELVHLQVHATVSSPALKVLPQALGDKLEVEIRIHGRSAGRFSLGEGRFVIGRSSACDIQVDESTMSRRHGELSTLTEVSYQDLDSSNGTQLNGEDVKYARLVAGDRLVLGKHTEIRVASIAPIKHDC